MTHGARSLLCLAVALVGCATQSTYDYSKEPDPRRSEYMVGASDVLRVNVWREPDLSVEVRVRPDGTITMPLIGDGQPANRSIITPMVSLLNALIKLYFQ